MEAVADPARLDDGVAGLLRRQPAADALVHAGRIRTRRPRLGRRRGPRRRRHAALSSARPRRTPAMAPRTPVTRPPAPRRRDRHRDGLGLPPPDGRQALLPRGPRRQRRRAGGRQARDVPPDDAFEAADKVPLESSVAVTGVVRADPRSPAGVELSVTGFDVVSRLRRRVPDRQEGPRDRLPDGGAPPLPAQQPPDRGAPHPRRGRARAARAPRRPRLHGGRRADLHAGGRRGHRDALPVDYFGEPAFLSQTGQLYMEAAAQALGKVYCFGPTFRAEKSKTRRHLTEFWMLEPEIAFGDLEEVMALMEGCVSHAVARVLESRRAELATLERDLAKLEAIEAPVPPRLLRRGARAPEGHARPRSRGARTSARRRRTRSRARATTARSCSTASRRRSRPST